MSGPESLVEITPSQIIGEEAYMQLVFEGYEVVDAAELSTLRSRCETLEAERDEAFEQCAKIAEWDMRTPMAISAGHKPEWYKHGLSIAKRIRNLAGRATQPARKEKG